MNLSAVGKRNPPSLFADNDDLGIRLLREAESRSVPQSQILVQIRIVCDRQDTAGCNDAIVRNHHGTVVQRTVLEENIFDQSGIYFGPEHLARMGKRSEVYSLLDGDESTGLLASHVHTGKHQGGYDAAFVLQVLLAPFLIEKAPERTPSACGAYRREHFAQLSLKKNDQHEEPQADELI